MTEGLNMVPSVPNVGQGSRFRAHLALAFGALAALHSEAGLVVTPDSGIESIGFPLGPFAPPSITYTLSNSTDAPLVWTAGRSQTWLSLSAAGGLLGPGETATMTVFLNTSALEQPLGTHAASVTFTNMSDESDVAQREARLQVILPAEPSVEFVPLASNSLVLRLTGQAGSTHVIEQSTNLLDWGPVQTNILAGDGVSYSAILPVEPQCLYRAQCSDTSAQPAALAIGTETTYLQSRRQVRVTGEPNGLYQLELSTNEGDWTPIARQKLCGTSEFIYTTSDSLSTGAVFRARAIDQPALPLVHHVLIVGQSLAFGTEGVPALTTEASDRHLRIFSDGIDTYVNPLFELVAETIASSAALQAVWDTPDHRMAFSNVGLGGAIYDQLKKGTANYARGLTQFSNAPQALACRLLGYRPAAVFAVHGEGDRHNPDYGTNVGQWQADYQADIRQITGDPGDVPMFHSQISSWTAGGGGTSQAVGPEKLLEESEANPTKTILVCPKYFLPHALPVGIHLTNLSYRWLGEYYGKAYRRVVVDGGTWTPLKPASITRAGAVITARFDVPVPPLVLDTNLVSDPGNYGFEYWDESGSPPSITAVELTGPDTVQITLAAEPTGANPRLRYAYTGIPGQPAGPTTGPRGNLHDSDSEPSLWEDPLFNWCVHFDKPIQ